MIEENLKQFGQLILC